MRFSVIMPVYLEPYEVFSGIKSATDPENKFIRAVSSFLAQSLTDAELVIVSDGCKKSEAIYMKYFRKESNIRFTRIDKQPLFSGAVRQMGLSLAEGEIICYLDHDDFIGEEHLRIINEAFKYEWVYFNDWLIQGKSDAGLIFTERHVSPSLYYIGTSMIAHRKDIDVRWGGGYAHDWRMIETYLLPRQGVHIATPQYYVCHFHPKDF